MRIKPILSLITAMLAVVLTGLSGLNDWFDRYSYDLLGRYAGPPVVSTDIVLIDIDRPSIEALTRWPFPRRVHAQAIEHLQQAGAKAIAYNIAFVTPELYQSADDAALIAAIEQHGRVVLPLLAERGHELLPLGKRQINGASYAHAELSADFDGLLRRSYLYAGVAYPRWPSLALAALQLSGSGRFEEFTGLRTPYVNVGFSHRWNRDYELLLPLAQQAYFAGAAHYSLLQLLKGEIAAELIAHKTVFVGIRDPEIEGLIRMPGVESISATAMQAFVFSCLNQGRTLSPALPLWSIMVGWVVVLSLVAACFYIRRGWRRWTWFGVSVTGLLIPIGFMLIGYWVSYLPMLAGLLALGGGCLTGRFVRWLRAEPSAAH